MSFDYRMYERFVTWATKIMSFCVAENGLNCQTIRDLLKKIRHISFLEIVQDYIF